MDEGRMDKVVLWVGVDGEWKHGTESDDRMAVELVGTALWGLADGVIICAPGVDPNSIGVAAGTHTGVHGG